MTKPTPLLLLSLSLFLCCYSSAQSIQKGFAYRYNGKNPRTGLQGALVQCEDATNNNVITAANGSFSLSLPSLKAGASLSVKVSKKGMIVMNRDVVAEWSVRDAPLVVVLRDAEEFKKEKERLSNTSEQAIQRIYKDKEAKLEDELLAGAISKKERAEQLAALQASIEAFRKQADSYSSFLAGIDLREVSSAIQDALALVNEGKPEAAAILLEEEDFPARLQSKQTKTETRARDELGARVLLAVYRLTLDWKKYENLLDRIITLSNKPEVRVEYGIHLAERGEYLKAIEILEQETKRLDRRITPEWYLSATNWLANAYSATGDNERTIHLCEDVLDYIGTSGDEGIEEDFLDLTKASFLTLQTVSMGALRMDNEDVTRKAITATRRASRSSYSSEGTSLLIIVLGNRAMTLSQQGRKEEAAALQQEIESLIAARPNGYVINPSTLTTRLLLVSEDPEALENTLRDNIDLCWELAKDTPWKYEPLIAQYEYTLATSIIAKNPSAKRIPEVEELLDESIDILRRYFDIYPESHSLGLANALLTLTEYFRKAGKIDDGVITQALEAVELIRPWAEKEPKNYGKLLAKSLANYAECINKTVDIKDPDEAKVHELVKYEKEAVQLMRQFTDLTKMERFEYFNMLFNLAISYKIYLGNTRESNRLIKEGTQIGDSLVQEDPQTFGGIPSLIKEVKMLLLFMKKGKISDIDEL